MLANNQVTGSCTIENGAVFNNGQLLFEKKESDINGFLLAIYHHFQLNYPKFYKMDNLSKLGWLAAEVLLTDTFKKGTYQPEEVGLVLANSNSSLDNDIKYFKSLQEFASPSLFVYTLPNIVIGEICIRNHFKGEHAFYVQESFDAAFIAQQVNYLLDNNLLKTCICGWVDILEQDYKAALFLVEKEKKEGSISFSAENMDRIFDNK